MHWLKECLGPKFNHFLKHLSDITSPVTYIWSKLKSKNNNKNVFHLTTTQHDIKRRSFSLDYNLKMNSYTTDRSLFEWSTACPTMVACDMYAAADGVTNGRPRQQSAAAHRKRPGWDLHLPNTTQPGKPRHASQCECPIKQYDTPFYGLTLDWFSLLFLEHSRQQSRCAGSQDGGIILRLIERSSNTHPHSATH